MKVRLGAQVTMQEVSGGIIGSALIIFVIGYSGLINLLLRYISPITGMNFFKPPHAVNSS